MAGIYRKYLQLLEKWPVDATKQNRDLGQFIRKQVKLCFGSAHVPVLKDEEKCRNTYEVLNKFVSNYYYTLYKRSLTSSATGLTAEQCKVVLSDVFLKYLKEEKCGFISRVFRHRRH